MPDPKPPTIIDAVYFTALTEMVVTFDQLMDQNPLIDPTRWVVKTGSQNRFGNLGGWTGPSTLLLKTMPQMGPQVPVEGVYSGSPDVLSALGLPLADQTFPLTIT